MWPVPRWGAYSITTVGPWMRKEAALPLVVGPLQAKYVSPSPERISARRVAAASRFHDRGPGRDQIHEQRLLLGREFASFDSLRVDFLAVAARAQEQLLLGSLAEDGLGPLGARRERSRV